VLAPFIYLGLIWMSAAGFLVFGDLPTLGTLSGAAVVILSGLYLLARERKQLGEAKAARPPTLPRNDHPPMQLSGALAL
jgi:drug/metabolite transporter (DMT)-like permease